MCSCYIIPKKNGGCLSDLEKALYNSKFFFTSEYNNNIGDTYYLSELLFKNEQGEVSYLNRYNGYGGICYDETEMSLLKDEEELINLIAEDFFSYMNWGKNQTPYLISGITTRRTTPSYKRFPTILFLYKL